LSYLDKQNKLLASFGTLLNQQAQREKALDTHHPTLLRI